MPAEPTAVLEGVLYRTNVSVKPVAVLEAPAPVAARQLTRIHAAGADLGLISGGR